MSLQGLVVSGRPDAVSGAAPVSVTLSTPSPIQQGAAASIDSSYTIRVQFTDANNVAVDRTFNGSNIIAGRSIPSRPTASWQVSGPGSDFTRIDVLEPALVRNVHLMVAQHQAGGLVSNSYLVAGVPTPPAQMPTSGGGSYTGYALGRGYIVGGNPAGTEFIGSTTMTVDFAAGKLTHLSIIATPSGGVGELSSVGLGLQLNTTVSGNSFAGTVGGTYSVSVGPNTTNTRNASGTLSGNFYGPASPLPVEAGGVFNVSGVNGDRIVGAFVTGR